MKPVIKHSPLATQRQTPAHGRAGGMKLSRRNFRGPCATTCISLRPSCRTTLKEFYFPLENFKRCYHRNQQYSVTAVTNGSAAVVERYAYSAYGTPTITGGSGSIITTSAISNRYTYTGREWDQALAMYHYRARTYDPVAGRFCARDPIGFEGSPWNLYEYVHGTPTTGLDPSGEAVPILVVGCALACASVPLAWGIGAITCAFQNDGQGPGAFGRCMRIFSDGLSGSTSANVTSFAAVQACLVCIFRKIAKPCDQTGLADDIAKGYGKGSHVPGWPVK